MAENDEERPITELLEERIEDLEEQVYRRPPETTGEAVAELRRAVRELESNTPGKKADQVTDETRSLFDTMPDLLDGPDPEEEEDDPTIDDIEDEEERKAVELERLERTKERLEGILAGLIAQRPGGPAERPARTARAKQRQQDALEWQISRHEAAIANTEARIAALKAGVEFEPPERPDPPGLSNPVDDIKQQGDQAASLATRVAGQAGQVDQALRPKFAAINGLVDRISNLPQTAIEGAIGIVTGAGQKIANGISKAFGPTEEPLDEASAIVDSAVSIQSAVNCESSQREIANAIEQKANQLGLPVPEPGAPVPPALRAALQGELGDTLSSAISAPTEGLTLAAAPFGDPGETLATLGVDAAGKMPGALAAVSSNLPGLQQECDSALDEALAELNSLA